MPYLLDSSNFVYQFETGAIVPVVGWLPIGEGLNIDLIGNPNIIEFPITFTRPAGMVSNLKTRRAVGLPAQVGLQLPTSIGINLLSTWTLPDNQFSTLNSTANAFNSITTGLGSLDDDTLCTTIAEPVNLPFLSPRPVKTFNEVIQVNQSAVALLSSSTSRSGVTITNCSNGPLYLGFNGLVSPNFYWRKLKGGEFCNLPASLIRLQVFAYSSQESQSVSITYSQLAGLIDHEGVYALSFPLVSSSSNLPIGVYQIPKLDGVVLRLLWNQIEPSSGEYDWSLLDVEIDRAIQYGKRLGLAIVCGSYTPSWIYSQGATRNIFSVNRSRTNPVCIFYDFPTPWDTIYLQFYDRMMAALADHLKEKQAYDTVAVIKITGINMFTPETRMPGRAETVDDSCTEPVQFWQAAGYRPAKALLAWQGLVTAIERSFPDKMLSMEVLESNDFPPINENGVIVSKLDPSYVEVKQVLIDWTIEHAPGRFSVQWDGLTATKIAPSVLTAGQKGAIVGWQTNQFRGFSGSGCGPLFNSTDQTCTEASYLAILQNGINNQGRYLEVFAPNAIEFPGAIAAAHDMIYEL